ncbi:MAG: hypothetical protein IKR40_08110 [Treponema sp.]|nr:hypothetical protein [Treponema sp.]
MEHEKTINLLNRYHLYLYSLGYEIKKINDNHCTITDYTDAVQVICDLEHKNVEELAKCVSEIFSDYDKGGSKNSLLSQSNNNRTLNGLRHFKEFIEYCNKSSL